MIDYYLEGHPENPELAAALKRTRLTKHIAAIAAIGAIACAIGTIPYALTGGWSIVLVNLVAFFFAVSAYTASKSAETSTKVALLLDNENAALKRLLAKAEEIKMRDIIAYNQRLYNYWKGNQ